MLVVHCITTQEETTSRLVATLLWVKFAVGDIGLGDIGLLVME